MKILTSTSYCSILYLLCRQSIAYSLKKSSFHPNVSKLFLTFLSVVMQTFENVFVYSSSRIVLHHVLFFNWASFLSWPNYPKHFRVGVAIWWSSLQMMLTLKLEGQPYGEVKNKICWPSKSSYQPPNGVRCWQWCIWEQWVKTDCRSFMIVNCVLNLFNFAYLRSQSWSLWTVQISWQISGAAPKGQ